MNSPHRHYHRLAWAAVLLAFAIVIFGAFVRLSNAGLSCPDWPTCYGRATWPVHEHEIAQANASFERAVETGKAWREQVHRHLAGGLGLLILLLALIAAQKRRFGMLQIAGSAALVAASIPLYIGKYYDYAAALALAGEAWLLIQAIRASNADASRLSAIVLMVVVFQAVLGMWTVTWLLKPVVVMAHLLGGLATFSLLTWLAWATTPNSALVQAVAPKLRRLLWIGLALLVLQIALGSTFDPLDLLAYAAGFGLCLLRWPPATPRRHRPQRAAWP